jgi:hypothetical protein
MSSHCIWTTEETSGPVTERLKQQLGDLADIYTATATVFHDVIDGSEFGLFKEDGHYMGL